METDNSIKEKHSPLPWHIDGHNLLAVIHKDEQGRWQRLASCSSERKEIEEDKANAELIVKAVNGYAGLEELNGALVEALRFFYDGWDDFLSKTNIGNSFYGAKQLAYMNDVSIKAKAALSKASTGI